MLPEMTVTLAMLDVVDIAAGGEGGGEDPAAGAFFELGDETCQEGGESVGEGDLLAVEEDDVAPPTGPDAAGMWRRSRQLYASANNLPQRTDLSHLIIQPPVSPSRMAYPP